MSLYGRKKMGRGELRDAAYACAIRLGLTSEDALNLTAESLVTRARLSKGEKAKSSHRLSHQRKKAALTAGAERTEYIESTSGRRHFAYTPTYEFEQVFFRLSLAYEIAQEESRPASVPLRRLRYRFVKHLVHAGIRAKFAALAAGVGTLLYRCGVAEVRGIYVELAKSAYDSWDLTAVVEGEEDDDSDSPKGDPTAAMRVAKNGMVRELLERFRHLTSPLLNVASFHDPGGLVELLRFGRDEAAAVLAERITARDPHALEEWSSEPESLERLVAAINLTLEGEQLFSEGAFKRAVGKRREPLAAPLQPRACHNRAALEEAFPAQVRQQPLALQKVQEGREMRIEYLERPDGRMIADSLKFLGSLAPWGVDCRPNPLEFFVRTLREMLGKTADPKGEAEADIHHAFVHPRCFAQLVESFLARKPEALLPRFLIASAGGVGDDAGEDGTEGGISDEFDSPPRMTEEQRSRLKDDVATELGRGDRAAPESLVVTVDGVEQGLTRLGSDSEGEKRYSFETSGSSELVQVWAPREAGRTLMAACLLREESETSRVDLKNATVSFEISYDGDYRINVTHLLKSPAPTSEKAAGIPAPEPGFTLRPMHVGLAVLILATAVVVPLLIWRDGGPVVTINTNGMPSPGTSPVVSTTPDVAVSNTPPQNENSQPGDRLRTLTDGEAEITADQSGNLSGPPIDALPDQLRRQIQAAWREGRLATPDLTGLEGAEIKTMGPGSDELRFRLRSPVRQVVRSQRPRFTWDALSEAESYAVTVSDADTYEVVDPGEPVKTTYWRPKRPLPRGRNYVWEVKALVKGQEVTMPTLGQHEAKFRVLDSSLEEELRRAEGASPRSRLALGVLYARAGLYSDARRELQAFASANPNSKTAAKLLGAVNRRLAAQ